MSPESPLAPSGPGRRFSGAPLAHPNAPRRCQRQDFARTASQIPYRWLESGDSEEVKHWTEEQNAVTRRVLDRVRERDRLHARLTDLLSIGTVGTPAVRKVSADKNRYFHVRREGHAESAHPLRSRRCTRAETRF